MNETLNNPQQPIHIHNEGASATGYLIAAMLIVVFWIHFSLASTDEKVASLQATIGTNAQSRIDRLDAISTFLYSNSTVVHGDLTQAGTRFRQDEAVLGVLFTNAVEQQAALSNIVQVIRSAQQQPQQVGGAGRSR